MVAEDYGFGFFEAGEALAAVFGEVVFGGGGAVFEDNYGADALAPVEVGDADDRRLFYGVVGLEDLLDFFGGDHFAAALDEVAGAAG